MKTFIQWFVSLLFEVTYKCQTQTDCWSQYFHTLSLVILFCHFNFPSSHCISVGAIPLGYSNISDFIPVDQRFSDTSVFSLIFTSLESFFQLSLISLVANLLKSHLKLWILAFKNIFVSYKTFFFLAFSKQLLKALN